MTILFFVFPLLAFLSSCTHSTNSNIRANAEQGNLSNTVGMLNGSYKGNNEYDTWVSADANAKGMEIALMMEGCAVIGTPVEQSQSLFIIATASDGACSFLSEITLNEEVAEVTPIKVAESGRINSFSLKTDVLAMKPFSGNYDLL